MFIHRIGDMIRYFLSKLKYIVLVTVIASLLGAGISYMTYLETEEITAYESTCSIALTYPSDYMEEVFITAIVRDISAYANSDKVYKELEQSYEPESMPLDLFELSSNAKGAKSPFKYALFLTSDNLFRLTLHSYSLSPAKADTNLLIYYNALTEWVSKAYPFIQIEQISDQQNIIIRQGEKFNSYFIVKNAIICAVLGFVFVCGIILIMYLFNPVVNLKDDLEIIYKVPKSKIFDTKRNCRNLAAEIINKNCKVIGVSSSDTKMISSCLDMLSAAFKNYSHKALVLNFIPSSDNKLGNAEDAFLKISNDFESFCERTLEEYDLVFIAIDNIAQSPEFRLVSKNIDGIIFAEQLGKSLHAKIEEELNMQKDYACPLLGIALI